MAAPDIKCKSANSYVGECHLSGSSKQLLSALISVLDMPQK